MRARSRMRRRCIALGAVAACLGVSAAPAQASDTYVGPRIVGGNPATQGQWPFMAFIYVAGSNGRYEYCSGAVVSPTVILTAAHCLLDSNSQVYDPGRLTVYTGDADWENRQGGQTSSVSELAVDPAYNAGKGTLDAGVLVLSAPVSAPSLPLSTTPVASGAAAWMVGWGQLGAPESDQTTLLHWAPTVLQSAGSCSAHYFFDPSTEICAASPSTGVATCFGDSGGPLVAQAAGGQKVELGVLHGSGDGCTPPSFYTSIAAISSWLRNWVGSAVPKPPSPAPKPTPIRWLTVAVARKYVRGVLDRALPSILQQARGYQAACLGLTAGQVQCQVHFASGRQVYYGSVTVSQTWSQRTDAYDLHLASQRCYHSYDPDQCATRELKGV